MPTLGNWFCPTAAGNMAGASDSSVDVEVEPVLASVPVAISVASEWSCATVGNFFIEPSMGGADLRCLVALVCTWRWSFVPGCMMDRSTRASPLPGCKANRDGPVEGGAWEEVAVMGSIRGGGVSARRSFSI